MKKWKLGYSVLFFAVCACPTIGMFFAGSGASAENRVTEAFPSIITDEGFNQDWLAQAGDYYQEHFGFRSNLVTAEALLEKQLLRVFSAKSVIQGTDGWLYYQDSLDDYLGIDQLGERSLFNIAHTMAMVQKQLEQKGVTFVFTVAPNKNTLYGENMPYYDQKRVTEENNLVRLKTYLDAEQVHYTDLRNAFLSEDEILYHKKDSHWNNKGAAMAADLLLTEAGKEHTAYQHETYEVRRDFEGDLDAMLYPEHITPEDEIYFNQPFSFDYVEEVENNFAPRISTRNTQKEGSLIVYRDSFGNALLPFLADEYGSAYFSRGIPYQMSDVETMGADTVIIERAERFLPEMAQSPPAMEAFRLSEDEAFAAAAAKEEMISEDNVTDLQIRQQGLLRQVTGSISQNCLETESRIYIMINHTEFYEAFPMDVKKADGSTECGGFSLYLPAAQIAGQECTVEVLTEQESVYHLIYKTIWKEENTKQ